MNKISLWLYNFMKGRYGFDQLGQALSVGVVVCWIASIIVGVVARFAGVWVAWLSSILNWAGVILLVVMIFRMMSRNIEKRRSENEAFLRRRQRKHERKNSSQKDIYTKENPQSGQGHTYLTCSFCGQQMRVPSGKGKIAVKCPSCGQKTIVKS